ncbi:LPXTG cell wall anchor domain-containing protein [Enterococcus faecalis]|nr:LPXTG cell wall anchor domain-containing protein [Enterococcus faecalis]
MKKRVLIIFIFSIFTFLGINTSANAEIVDSSKSEAKVGFYEGTDNKSTIESKDTILNPQKESKVPNKLLPSTGSLNNMFLITIGIGIIIFIVLIKIKTKDEENI